MYFGENESKAEASSSHYDFFVSKSRTLDDMTTPSEPKLVVVVGATGNQGNSVARRFLREGFHVRGLTRYPDSPASQYLTSLGAEMARADIFDVESLKAAFKGARVIFSVTNYWDPFHPDRLQESRAKAKALNMGTVREYAGHVERIAGQNIADAAATTVETLDGNGFIASTLSHAGKCSGGRFRELHHFDAKADVFPYYVRDEFPDLAAKMSCVQTGFFMSSHRILPDSYLAKVGPPSLSYAHLEKQLTSLLSPSAYSSQMAVSKCDFALIRESQSPTWILWRTWEILYTPSIG